MEHKIYTVSGKPLTLEEVRKESKVSSPRYLWDEKERMCPCECGSKEWILLPKRLPCVKEGGKRYMICLFCGVGGMHL